MEVVEAAWRRWNSPGAMDISSRERSPRRSDHKLGSGKKLLTYIVMYSLPLSHSSMAVEFRGVCVFPKNSTSNEDVAVQNLGET